MTLYIFGDSNLLLSVRDIKFNLVKAFGQAQPRLSPGALFTAYIQGIFSLLVGCGTRGLLLDPRHRFIISSVHVQNATWIRTEPRQHRPNPRGSFFYHPKAHLRGEAGLSLTPAISLAQSAAGSKGGPSLPRPDSCRLSGRPAALLPQLVISGGCWSSLLTETARRPLPVNCSACTPERFQNLQERPPPARRDSLAALRLGFKCCTCLLGVNRVGSPRLSELISTLC